MSLIQIVGVPLIAILLATNLFTFWELSQPLEEQLPPLL